jgi:glycosyltransferase involved in cell wall biosynthesis
VRRRAVPPTVLCLGDACTARAPEQFAELAARFCFAGESARFVWVGAGPPHYERLLRAAGVTLAGWGSAATVADMLAGAAVVVLTGREHGAPRVLAQAMASAAPIVAMNLPCHRELVRHDATALLADELSELALHVKALIDDRQRAEALGVAARAEARRRFPPERFPQALLDLYRLPGGSTAIPAAHDAVPRFDAAAP